MLFLAILLGAGITFYAVTLWRIGVADAEEDNPDHDWG